MLKSILFVLIFSFFMATIIGPFFIPFLHPIVKNLGHQRWEGLFLLPRLSLYY